MNRTCLLPAMILALSGVSFAADLAERGHRATQQTVHIAGEGRVVGGDSGAALDHARAAAMRAAVEQVIGAYVTVQARTVNGKLIEDRVMVRSSGFASIKQITQREMRGDTLHIEADVTVSAVPLVQLLRDSGVLRQWRVMAIIPEHHIQRRIPDPAAETEFLRQFVQAGYKVIDQSRYAELRDQQAERFRDPKVVQELGRKMGADVVIVGEAFSERVPDVRGLICCSARVEARAILVDTAEVVSVDATDGAAADASEAVASKKALQRVAQKLAPLFVNDVTLLPAAAGRKIQIEVGVFKSITLARRFEEALRTLPGVTRLHRESFDAGLLVLEVEVEPDAAEALAERLESDVKMRAFSLAVSNASTARIIARVSR